MKLPVIVSLVALCSVLSGCMSASKHAADVQKGLDGDKMTVGTVQREIRQGMSGAEVAQVLGSPNIVTTDEKGREVWVYDRIATDKVYSSSSGGISALFFGGGVPGPVLGGAASGTYDSSAGAASTSQRTFTVIIKYDENKKVRDFAYHYSRF